MDPIQPDLTKIMNEIGRRIGSAIKEHGNYGFALFVFTMDVNDYGHGNLNYISNANREDMIVALKEFIARQEGRYQEPQATGQ
jgi:hypothetical protein